MLNHAHVVTRDGHDWQAYTSKDRVLAVGDEERRRLGLTPGEVYPESFHYSVVYIPDDVNSDQLFIVNVGMTPLYGYDSQPRAIACAEELAAAGRTNITINVVSFIRSGQSELETTSILAGVKETKCLRPRVG